VVQIGVHLPPQPTRLAAARLKTDPHKKALFAAKIGGMCAKSHLALVKSQCNKI
jgi:hypothetical protein